MKHKLNKKLLFYILIFSLLFPSEKITFSANNLENINNDIENIKKFKGNVIIEKNNLELYSNLATHYPDCLKVYLEGNVKMYDMQDTLFCSKLVLYDQEIRKFTAIGNVNYSRQAQRLSTDKLKYTALNENDVLIELFNNASIKDSMRTVKGDTILANYSDSLIKQINVDRHAEIINIRYAKTNGITIYEC